MKRKVVILVSSISLLTAAIFIVGLTRYQSRQTKKSNQANYFPVTDLLSLDHNVYSTRPLADSALYKLIVIFNPDCDHCQYEIAQLTKARSRLTAASCLFISPKPVEELGRFEKMRIDSGNPAIRIFEIKPDQWLRLFKGNPLPDIYLYGPNNALIKNFWGETPAEVIIQAINQ